MLGFSVTVCDARPVFATRARFPLADEVVVEWPDRYLAKVGPELGPRDAVCVLTHDTKFDVPAILQALRTKWATWAPWVHAGRTRRGGCASKAGADESELKGEAHDPIGLDIGARTPEETAVAICAEIIATRTGRAELRRLPTAQRPKGPIHRP